MSKINKTHASNNIQWHQLQILIVVFFLNCCFELQTTSKCERREEAGSNFDSVWNEVEGSSRSLHWEAKKTTISPRHKSPLLEFCCQKPAWTRTDGQNWSLFTSGRLWLSQDLFLDLRKHLWQTSVCACAFDCSAATEQSHCSLYLCQ